MAIRKVFLFATVGRTDLQVLVQKDGRLYRINIDNELRDFHQALLSKTVDYIVRTVPDAVELARPAQKGIRVHWDPDRSCLVSEPAELVVEEDGRIILVPAKLCSLVAKLKERDARGKRKYRVVGSVVFSTRREGSNMGDERFYRTEPIACGSILAGWLAKELELRYYRKQGYRKNFSCWVDLLRGKMISPGTGRDYPILRAAIRRVDKLMRRIVNDEADVYAWMSFGGGLPETKEPIKECARYHFENRIIYWHEPQFGEFVSVSPGKEIPSIQESYQARNQARTLIRHGNFVGAYAAVKHLVKDKKESRWITKLEKVARYFSGELRSRGDQPEYLHTLVGKAPRCLLVGMRCEAALLSGRLPEAVAWTCAFFDAALLDFIERYSPISFLDDLKQEVTVNDPSRLDPGLKVLIQAANSSCLTQIGMTNKYQYKSTGPAVINQWIQALKSELDCEPLLNYYEALIEGKSQLKPKNLRNVNLHSVLSVELVEQVWDIFKAADLWGYRRDYGKTFLGMDLAHDMLSELKIGSAKDLYQTLVNGLIQDLSNHTIS